MSSISALARHTGYLLRVVSNAVSHGFARALAAHDVTVAEWVMLRALQEGPAVAPSMLAGRMGMTRGAISKLADRLIEKGLVLRADHPRDRRAYRLSLSAQGALLVPQLAAIADRNDDTFFGPLDRAEHDQLRALLTRLIDRHGLSAPALD